MSVATRVEKKRANLASLEEEFRTLLISTLRKCSDGGRGPFLREAEAARRGWSGLVWPEAKRLDELGNQILELRTRLGEIEQDTLYGMYLRYCEITGENAPGGAKLAHKFLNELREEPEASGY